MRKLIRSMCAAAALAVAAPQFATAAPAPAAPAKAASPMDSARKALDEVGDMKYENKSLNEVVEDLKAKAKVPVTLDPIIFQFGLNPNMQAVNVTAKNVKLRDGLRQALAPFNLKCGVTKDGIFISTEEGLTNKQLRQRVSVDCDGTPFAATIKQLAADTGANVVLDPRLKDKANAAVTLKLDDVPLETAVRLLSEVADLGAIRMNNVLFVTTAERAEKLRPAADGPTQPGNNPVFPFPGGPDGPFPVPIGPGVPGVILPGGPAVDPLPAEKPVEAKPAPAPEKPPVQQEKR
jgi:hypothetical protein